MQITDENIRQLKDVVRHETPRLLRLPGVLSVGVALKLRNGVPTETLCVRVTVKKKKPVEPVNINEQRIEDVIRVPGYPVDVIEIKDNAESSEPRICDVSESEARTGTYDVLKGGIGIYSEQDGEKQPYGTLGMIVYDRRDNQPLILTTKDVLSAIPVSETGQKEHLEELFQGELNSNVGDLLRSDFSQIHSRNDYELSADFLVADIIPDRKASSDVEEIEFDRVLLEPKLGMPVWKSGAQSGVTKGIIIMINGNDFRVGRETGGYFSCDGDTGAIVFGEKDGKKRPVGMVTRFYDTETKEVRCVSLRSALIGNPFLNISLTNDCFVNTIHRFWNEGAKSTFDSPLTSQILGGIDINYRYQGPVFESIGELESDYIPLHEWYNTALIDHVCSIDEHVEGRVSEGYAYNSQVAYVSASQREGMQQLHRVVNNQTNDHKMLFANQLPDARASGYELDISRRQEDLTNPLPITSSAERKWYESPVAFYVRSQTRIGAPSEKAVVVNTGKRKKFTNEAKRELAKRYRHVRINGQLLFVKDSKTGALRERFINVIDRCHILGDHEMKRIVHGILNSMSTRGEQYNFLKSIGHKPANHSKLAINNAAIEWRTWSLNNLENLFPHYSHKNRKLGAKFVKEGNLLKNLDWNFLKGKRIRFSKKYLKRRIRIRMRQLRTTGAAGGIFELIKVVFELISNIRQGNEQSAWRDEQNSNRTSALFLWWFKQGLWQKAEGKHIKGASHATISLVYNRSLKFATTPAQFYKLTQIDDLWKTQALDFNGRTSLKVLDRDDDKFKQIPISLEDEMRVNIEKLYRKLDRSKRTGKIGKNKIVKHKGSDIFIYTPTKRSRLKILRKDDEYSFLVIEENINMKGRKVDWVEPLDMVLWERSHNWPWPDANYVASKFREFSYDPLGNWIFKPNPHGYLFLKKKS